MCRLPCASSTPIHLPKPPPTEAPTDTNGAGHRPRPYRLSRAPSPLHL
jgi:hypothetical protein